MGRLAAAGVASSAHVPAIQGVICELSRCVGGGSGRRPQSLSHNARSSGTTSGYGTLGRCGVASGGGDGTWLACDDFRSRLSPA
jgi:hypothetical protein